MLSVCSSFSHASVPRKTRKPFTFSGGYIGSSVGYNQTSIKSSDIFKSDYDNLVIQNMHGYSNHTTFSGGSIRGALYGGYGHQYQAFYTGFEIEVAAQNIKAGQQTAITYDSDGNPNLGELSSHDVRVTLKDSYALSFKSGYVFHSHHLLYLKLGGILSRWDIYSYYPSFSLEPALTDPHYKISKRRLGLLVGAGMDKALSNRIIAGAEIKYECYTKTPYSHPHFNQGSVRPSSFAFTVKIGYKF